MSKASRDLLAEEATEAEARQSDPPERMQRATSKAARTSQVYTVRMPADRLEELRTTAAQFGEQPSTLMRRWVLERLDDEQEHRADLDDVRRSLSDALHVIDQLTPKCTA